MVFKYILCAYIISKCKNLSNIVCCSFNHSLLHQQNVYQLGKDDLLKLDIFIQMRLKICKHHFLKINWFNMNTQLDSNTQSLKTEIKILL